jgi:hypothetical protein
MESKKCSEMRTQMRTRALRGKLAIRLSRSWVHTA